MKHIGFDMDGVIVDNSVLKAELYYERTGIHLEYWKFNSNIIDGYITDKQLRREIDRISAISLHRTTTEENIVNVLSNIKTYANIYLISTRGKSEEGIIAARQTVEQLNIASLFGNNIYFTKSDSEKVEKVLELSLDLFVEDRFDVLDRLPEAKGILFDQFNLWKKYKRYSIVRSLTETILLVRS